MRTRTRTAIVALAALTALALAAVATAAYTSPKLSVSYAAANVTRIVASASVDNDATARAAITIPTGTTLTTTAAPGTKVGTAKAQVSALALGGALLPLAGDIVVAPPGSVPVTSQATCIGTVTPQATLMLVLQAAGQTILTASDLLDVSKIDTITGNFEILDDVLGTTTATFTVVSVVPEPSGVVLALSAAGCLWGWTRLRRRGRASSNP